MPLQVTAVVRDGPGRRTWSLSVHHSDRGVSRTSPQLRYGRYPCSRMDSTCSGLSIQHPFNLEAVLVRGWTDRTNDDRRERPGTCPTSSHYATSLSNASDSNKDDGKLRLVPPDQNWSGLASWVWDSQKKQGKGLRSKRKKRTKVPTESQSSSERTKPRKMRRKRTKVPHQRAFVRFLRIFSHEGRAVVTLATGPNDAGVRGRHLIGGYA